MNNEWKFSVSPNDESNENLITNVHPSDWINPNPKNIYNLVVIGAGTAGLISAIGAASLGGRVALVERHLMGGDCLNVGCVPSKALIRSSKVAHQTAHAQKYGLSPKPVADVDFTTVMARLRNVRANISAHDAALRYKKLGIDVFLGEAIFRDAHHVLVGEKILRFRKAIIATGARAVRPSIPGLSETGYLTNETLFNVTTLPKRLAVIGAGPIGCEMAQAFRRLGAEVTIITRNHILPREDPEASAILTEIFIQEGITVMVEAKTVKVDSHAGGKRITVQTPDGKKIVEVDEILIGAGRKPNVDGLGLMAAGIEYDERSGIRADDFLRTTNRNVYAAGDCCMAWKFTHAADAAARIAVQNALFHGKKRLSALTMPWCTYTDPEIAHVGLYEEEAKRKGIKTESFKVEMAENDRAVTDGETVGFVKLLVRSGSDQIVGATIMASHAGDLISEISVAMAGKIGLKTLDRVIHPYPTQADAIRRAAGAYNKKRLTPRVGAFLKWLLERQLR